MKVEDLDGMKRENLAGRKRAGSSQLCLQLFGFPVIDGINFPNSTSSLLPFITLDNNTYLFFILIFQCCCLFNFLHDFPSP